MLKGIMGSGSNHEFMSFPSTALVHRVLRSSNGKLTLPKIPFGFAA